MKQTNVFIMLYVALSIFIFIAGIMLIVHGLKIGKGCTNENNHNCFVAVKKDGENDENVTKNVKQLRTYSLIIGFFIVIPGALNLLRIVIKN